MEAQESFAQHCLQVNNSPAVQQSGSQASSPHQASGNVKKYINFFFIPEKVQFVS